MKYFPDTVAASTFENVQATAAEATKTIAAVADQIHVIDFVTFGFDRAPTAASLFKITIGGNILFQQDYPATSLGPIHVPFIRGLYGNTNEAVVFSLADGTGGSDKGSISYGFR